MLSEEPHMGCKNYKNGYKSFSKLRILHNSHLKEKFWLFSNNSAVFRTEGSEVTLSVN